MAVGEDVDLCWRIRKQGFQLEYRPVGKIFHKHRNRIASFCSRRFDYGTSEPLLGLRYPEKIKRMTFVAGAAVFWGAIVAAVCSQPPILLLAAAAALCWDTKSKSHVAARIDRAAPLSAVFTAVIRSYLSLFYHVASFFSRYYLIWSVALLPLLPVGSGLIASAHFLTAMVEYGLKKPQINPLQFLFYFTMEQLAYQCGVWWQSLKSRSFKAVNPHLTAIHWQKRWEFEWC